MMSFGLIAISQNNDTLITITPYQLKQIRLMSNELDYCTDLVEYNKKVMQNQADKINNLLKVKTTLEDKSKLQGKMYKTNNAKNDLVVLGLEKEISKQKLHKWIAIGVGSLFGILLIAK